MTKITNKIASLSAIGGRGIAKSAGLMMLALVAGTSCSDDEKVAFELPANAVQFVPYMGGAVMRYNLNGNADIQGIQVAYTDGRGTEMLRTASALSDSLIITGFDYATENVPCEVSLQYRDGSVSEPQAMTFSTIDSSPVQFVKSVNVSSCWNGFSVSYKNPENASGMAHIFYLGVNPHTNLPDTVLIESLPLYEGSDTITYELKQETGAENTVIVRVEDYRGYMVEERVWEHVKNLQSERLDPSNFKLHYENSVEIPEENVGLQYLTDGDTKGEIWWTTKDPYKYYTFISDANGAGEESKPMYIDMQKPRYTAEVRFYGMLPMGYEVAGWDYVGRPSWDGTYGPSKAAKLVNGYYYNRLPCDLVIYGSKQDIATTDYESLEWEQIGKFADDPKVAPTSMWCNGVQTCGKYYTNQYESKEAVAAADPIYLGVKFMAEGQGDGYRYLKIVYNKTYAPEYDISNYDNSRIKRITLHELEVYTAK